MPLIDWRGYRRRLDCFEYRPRQRDLPRDVVELMELAREIELTDKIIVDREELIE